MSKHFEIGDSVEWDWGNGTATGTITARHTEKVTKTIEGSDITRNATQEEPAFTIEQDDGDEVLKSITEVRSA